MAMIKIFSWKSIIWKQWKRPEISAQIAEARDKGDLSENAEYDAAKEAQGIMEAKLSQLKVWFQMPAW